MICEQTRRNSSSKNWKWEVEELVQRGSLGTATVKFTVQKPMVEE